MTSDIPTENPHPFIKIRVKYRHTFDAVALLVYLLFVYSFALWSHPIGRDYAHLADNGVSLPPIARELFAWEIGAFGDHAVWYRLVNLAFFYACMHGIYHFTNLTVRGFWWFGTFAACLFMANPAHTEALVNLSGIGDIIPCFAGIVALLAYALHVYYGTWWTYPLPLAIAAIAMLLYPANTFLFAVLVLYEYLAVVPDKRNWRRTIPLILIGGIAVYVNRTSLLESFPGFGQMFGVLYFLFYPLGFLPETAHRFVEYPLLAWLSGALVVCLLVLILRKANRPVILFGLLGMVLLRLHPGDRPIDPVHMIGGGQLLLPHVLFLISILGIIFRAMDHPRWRLPLVGLTSSIAAIFFAMQIISNRTWHKTGIEVRQFQSAAVAYAEANPSSALGILPDYQNLRGAPACFSDSIAYNTPFSKKVNAVSLLRMNADAPRYLNVSTDEWTTTGGVVEVHGKLPRDVSPWPMTWSREGDVIETDAARMTVQEVSEHGFSMVIEAHEGKALPAGIIPGDTRWYPDRGLLRARRDAALPATGEKSP